MSNLCVFSNNDSSLPRTVKFLKFCSKRFYRLANRRCYVQISRNLSDGFTLRRVLSVFMRSAITRSKVNRFGCNREHSDYIAGGWPWRIFGAILAVATLESQASLYFCQVNNARFHWFSVGQLSRHLNTRCRVDRWGDKNFRSRILP